MAQSADRFQRIFHPKRVAIVGVSAEGFGFGEFISLRIPVFDELSHAMKALSNVSRYYETRRRRGGA